jgi:hypothetical protein
MMSAETLNNGGGGEHTSNKSILASLDIENPNRSYLFNDRIVNKIANVLGGKVTKVDSPNSPCWVINIGSEINFCSIQINSYSKQEDCNKLIQPAYDLVWIHKYDVVRGRGSLQTHDCIIGVTSVEIDGDRVTFVQNIKAWEFSYTIDSEMQPETYFKSKKRPHAKTVGFFSVKLDIDGKTKPICSSHNRIDI